MPTRPKKKKSVPALPAIPKELIDHFVNGPMSAEAVNAASMAFKKALIERALGAELTHHLGYPPGTDKPEGADNHRNGVSGKTVLTDEGPLRIEVPRDRLGRFEPLFIPKHERRFTGFDDKIVAMYARGMTVREIQGFLLEQYGTEVSPEFISTVTDGLKGMGEALGAVFPATTLQTCIVHLIRSSLDYASWKDRKTLAAALRPIYTAPSAEAAEAELDTFEQGPWGKKFPTVVSAWRRAWDKVIPFFAFPPPIRRVIYTTNAIESLNARLRKIIKTRGHFPSDDAATKLLWRALRNITADWGRAAKDWKEAMNQFAILYEDRFTRTAV